MVDYALYMSIDVMDREEELLSECCHRHDSLPFSADLRLLRFIKQTDSPLN